MHPAALAVEDLLAQCEITRTRRGGPGGQHRNKVETAVVIEHRPTGTRGQASERRSQDLNRQEAIQRLRVNLALAVREQAGENQQPSTLWKSRSGGGQLHVSGSHADFPALLAEAIDCLAACGWDASAAAQHLHVSASQLVKFLKVEPAALAQLNAARREQGLKPLQ
jgi:hypothetical protein